MSLVLFCSLGHDESTFRSGEVSAKRWIYGDDMSLFSKGRGRSVMISDFMVSHPSGPFFNLNDKEWDEAINKYPNLLRDTDDVNYINHTASATISIGTDSYFDNDAILLQFERLFQMLQFKSEYKSHYIDILVDNARTHTARQYSIYDFGKNINTRCPVNQIEFTDENGVKKLIYCYFQSGPNKNKSKGLLELPRN